MHDHVERVLIDRSAIADRVGALARQIAQDMAPPVGTHAEVTLVSVMTGSVVFLADLIRHLPLLLRVRLLTVSSYPGKATQSQGPRVEGLPPEDLAGHHVLVVDDILDSGKTLELVCQTIRRQNPASLRTCVLLKKQVPRQGGIEADYFGFEIPDDFVVGYGLDFDGRYRNLPDIVTLKRQVLA